MESERVMLECKKATKAIMTFLEEELKLRNYKFNVSCGLQVDKPDTINISIWAKDAKARKSPSVIGAAEIETTCVTIVMKTKDCPLYEVKVEGDKKLEMHMRQTNCIVPGHVYHRHFETIVDILNDYYW